MQRTCSLSLWFIATAIVFLLIGERSAHAQYPIQIKNVRVGLPPGPFNEARDDDNQPAYLWKAASWAPVSIDLECVAAIDQPTITVIVEVADGDDVIAASRFRVAAPKPGRTIAVQELGSMPYVKPGSVASEITVHIRGADDKPLADSWKRRATGIQQGRFLLLSVGASLPGLRLPRSEGQISDEATTGAIRNGWVEPAQITRVFELPDQWIGYKAVDLLILCTATDPDFWRQLALDAKRQNALAEWVRRGGRLVISVGANAESINALPTLAALLPAKLARDGKRTVNQIPLVLPNSQRMFLTPGPLSLQLFEPPYSALLIADEQENPPPLVVQGSLGCGRVTVVAFDLDRPPFVDWRHREAFWEWLINSAGSRMPSGNEKVADDRRPVEGEDEYLNRMQNNMEFFEGVPVVSFGWVALLILLYILLIGPIEYLILKKLLKKLEWTWLTFPIIVISVCATAYLGARSLKGRDLKVNKLDVVDVDLRENRVYGQTWFTIFSPRIQTVTLGIEPAGPRGDDPSKPAWFPASAEQTHADTVVSWHGKARNNRQSLFRRTYSYHTQEEPNSSTLAAFATGLDQIPLQVWSTKAFHASWSAPLNPQQRLFESTLRISAADPTQIHGTITSNLPIAVLTDAQLIYRDHITPLPPLVSGSERAIATSKQSAAAAAWLQNALTHKDLLPANRSSGAREPNDDPTFRLWPVLFHEMVTGQYRSLFNASLRDLDQSWRTADRNPHEAILIARIGRAEGAAEAMSISPQSPSRLWFGALPGNGPRPTLTGTLRQETYIRVFIPISPIKK